MGKPKKTKEEVREKKRLAARQRRERIKNDPILCQQSKEKEKERYKKRKGDKRILPICEMSPKNRKKTQKRNRVNFRAYYKRKKEKLETIKKEVIEDIDVLDKNPKLKKKDNQQDEICLQSTSFAKELVPLKKTPNFKPILITSTPRPSSALSSSSTESMLLLSNNEQLTDNKDTIVNITERASSLCSTPDDVAEELLKVTDVWSYFDTDSSGKRAQCVPCKTTVANEYEDLKAHLKDNHPKLLLQILQNKDQNSDAASNDGDTDNENIFTEVVYLDPEPTENVTKKEKPKSHSKPTKKRERQQSICISDESPVKKIKKDEENDELSTFIKYITCLLKKLPADVFSSVQIEIINTILRANAQASTRNIVFSKEQVNTCSNIITVDGITPITSSMVGHNYTITVAAPKENEAENS